MIETNVEGAKYMRELEVKVAELKAKCEYLRSAQDSTYRDAEMLRRLIYESNVEDVPLNHIELFNEVMIDQAEEES